MLIRSLEIFQAVVESGSFSAAAERLHTVQSNVTAHIKKLESELGVRVLERRNPVALTSAGHQLLGYARRIGDLHSEALNHFKGGGEPTGELRLGSMETTAAVHLPKVLPAFSRRWPAVSLNLRTSPSACLLDELREGRLDAAFVIAGNVGDGLIMRPVFRERLVLVSGRPLDGVPSAAELSRTSFLSFRQGCGYRQTVSVLLAEQGAPPAPIHELGSLDAILGCVSSGMGLAVLPESTVRQYRHRYPLHSVALPEALSAVTTAIATAEENTWSRPLRAFMEGPWLPDLDEPSRPALASV
ncbi:Transcriptional regulator, LysR family [Alloalcanivorax xenomutans]|jgi:DNA-binding transcriptional LysR family regulator|uniref:LysR substrate-binding domain-containing protein n=1 Tax=Alloalcanivorax xenomutans TaxID=1094342 RepID=UPI0006D5BA3F|nr:LysR substrate-binding domain-containing protein [Alloalcanivorax xenomutans]PHS72458.1 MAG: LysR family transcriptional regulator [Alcanivorax sp.]CUR48054.1 Transcriptional regulator, LysR family [Alloalcanivorax xenomutans]